MKPRPRIINHLAYLRCQRKELDCNIAPIRALVRLSASRASETELFRCANHPVSRSY